MLYPVAQYLNVYRIKISRLQLRFHHSVSVSDRQRSVQPHVTTPAQDRYIHPPHPKIILSFP